MTVNGLLRELLKVDSINRDNSLIIGGLVEGEDFQIENAKFINLKNEILLYIEPKIQILKMDN